MNVLTYLLVAYLLIGAALLVAAQRYISRSFGLALLVFVAAPAYAQNLAPNSAELRPSSAAPLSDAPVLLILGDSLSAAYGIQRNEGWPALLTQRLQENRNDATVVNASISGETTSGGLRRLPELLTKHKPSAVIVELGANDGLRGQSLKAMKHNLLAIINHSQQAGAKVLLLGMYIPSNYGRAYVEKFHAVYGDLAQQTGSGLVDFMLEPIAFDEANFLEDRIHPNAAAQPMLLEHLWPAINSLITTE